MELTEDLKKKIEENRRAAQEKLARNKTAQQARQQALNPKPRPIPITEQKNNININNYNSKPFNQNQQNNSYQNQQNGQNSYVYNHNSTEHKQNTKYPTTSSNKQNINQASTTITPCSCILLSRERFYVDLGYHAKAIEIFKANKAIYEPSIRKWSFHISQHKNLLMAMQALKPEVTIGGLPAFVLKALKNVELPKIPDIDLSPIDPVLLRTLLPFQKEGICFGISRGGRVLIADDMGLGKTIQALGIAHYYYKEWPLLIVTPCSMRYTWREAIWNWLPSVSPGKIFILESGKSGGEDLHAAKVIIANYDIFTKRSAEFEKMKVVIMDESHNLKNSKSIRTKKSIPIIKSSSRAILLSGTPALSKPIELFTQISSLLPYLFSNIQEFGIRYCNGRQLSWGWNFEGSSNLLELQLVLEETVMIRRLKSEVLTQLSPKRREMLFLDPSLIKTHSKKLLTTGKEFSQCKSSKSLEKRGKLLEWYAETGIAKVEAIKSYIVELLDRGEKFLCFGHHRAVLDAISCLLQEKETNYIRIDGSTSSEERKRLVDKFQNEDKCLVALLSIKAANSGITLTAAKLALFAELFWNPGILTQAEDRAHRIGQDDSVLVQYLIAKGTADDFLWPLLQDKLDILNKVGLSKDNFREADTNALKQSRYGETVGGGGGSTSSRQTGIDEFFHPFSNEELACLLKSEEEQESGESLDWMTESSGPESPPKKLKY